MKRHAIGTAAVILVVASALGLGVYNARAADGSKVVAEMAGAATAFLGALDEAQRGKASFDFKSDERQNWHFIPKDRKGLPLKEMNADQKKLALALLGSGLSQKGVNRATTIMSLESILAEMEGPNRKFPRDPELYYVSIFGKPAAAGTWGWRVEGHHVSVNITLVGGKMVGGAPLFMGANPQLVKEGPRKGLRAVGDLEELGRAIVKSLNDDQKKDAIYDPKAPGDILTAAERRVKPLEGKGLAVSKMTPAQAEQLKGLVKEYAASLRAEISGDDLAKIEKAGWDGVLFAWAGGVEPGQPHYYRIQGATFLIEYDNVQNGANHSHTVWRDFDGDFGEDLLKKHLEQDHK